ncbi:unnamed protein product [Tuber aestivum]|uniref:Uncharacterized protein n=1 Tax=Tuber aestivum TaxID=59557 RepID=A0A292Q427_9PEZI|nr:unnamed protein product [Tuber aestivum]
MLRINPPMHCTRAIREKIRSLANLVITGGHYILPTSLRYGNSNGSLYPPHCTPKPLRTSSGQTNCSLGHSNLSSLYTDLVLNATGPKVVLLPSSWGKRSSENAGKQKEAHAGSFLSPSSWPHPRPMWLRGLGRGGTLSSCSGEVAAQPYSLSDEKAARSCCHMYYEKAMMVDNPKEEEEEEVEGDD